MTRLKVFISYSHADEHYKEELLKHLSGLKRHDVLDLWEDGRIEPGNEWFEEIKQAIADSHTALLLVSANFMNSEFIARHELPDLLRRSADEGLRVVPIIVSDCDWTSLEYGRFQALPKSGRSIEEAQFPNRE